MNGQGIFMNEFDFFYVDDAMPTTPTTTALVTVSPPRFSKHCNDIKNQYCNVQKICYGYFLFLYLCYYFTKFDLKKNILGKPTL